MPDRPARHRSPAAPLPPARQILPPHRRQFTGGLTAWACEVKAPPGGEAPAEPCFTRCLAIGRIKPHAEAQRRGGGIGQRPSFLCASAPLRETILILAAEGRQSRSE